MDEEKGGILRIVGIRLFWLLIGLFVSLLVSKYIHQFEEILQNNILVVTFIPLIVYLADAIGTQMESIIIRVIAQDKKFKFTKFFVRQILITSLIAFFLGFSGYIGSFLLYKNFQISLGLSIAIVISAFSALLTGTIIPYMFWKLHEDPAEASGPIATVIQDTLSILIYFVVIKFILG